MDEQLVGTASPSTAEITWENPSIGKHLVTAVIKDARGTELVRSPPAEFEILSDVSAQ